MKLTRTLVIIFSTILVFVVDCGSWVLFAEHSLAQNISVPPPQLTSQIPVNPKRSFYSPEINVGEFAWQAFVALNWPADCEGKPLEDQIGTVSDSPRVWEFYNIPEQIFLPQGQSPSPVQSAVPPQCQNPQSQTSQSYSQSLQLFEGERESNKANKANILLPDREVLVDQSQNYILSEIRLNPIEVGQIVKNKWYSADNLQNFNNNVNAPTDPKANPFALVCSQKDKNQGIYQKQFPCLQNDDVGAIELKAAWMVLPDPIPAKIKSKYYTTSRTFGVEKEMSADGEKKEVTVPVALIGFHVVQKTSQKGWTWATFEHLDNAPDQGQTSFKSDYNLFNPGCKENCEENRPYAEKPYLWRDDYPHAVTKKDGELKEQIPSQITRVIPITNVAKSLNQKWLEALKKIKSDSIWQNYQLIGVQWLDFPNFPYPEQPDQLPTGIQPSPDLANVTLEPYIKTKLSVESSCIACHVKAYLPSLPKIHADFSFLLNDAQRTSNPRNGE